LTASLAVDSWAQKLPLVYTVENTGADYPTPAFPAFSKLPSMQSFPDPFIWADGRGRIANYSDWRLRRAELGAQFQYYEIGQKPARPDTITATYSGGVLTVIVRVKGRTLTLTSNVILPSGSGPFAAVIGMNSPSGSLPSSIFSSRNIARITFSHDQVTAYNNPQNTDPYYQLYPALNIDNTGQYSAWAWGVSRIIDGLELVQNVLPIDLKHIAVTGCSYAGKMALFAGAFDERVALTIAQESGGGGATSWRYSQTEPSGSVETLGATSHQWFSEGMFQFSGANLSKLPIDHHELCAMVAPRALYVTANPDYIWLSNPSCYVNSTAVQQIYGALGVPTRFGFSIVGGHAHCAVPGSQIPEIESFVDKFLLGKDSLNFYIGTTPYSIDTSPWITWLPPSLANGTSSISWTSLRYPADQQTGLDTTITFRWNKAQDAQQYVIQVSLDPTFAVIEKSDSVSTDTTRSISGLVKAKQYYWRVKVQSAAGVGLWSNVSSFITVATPARTQLLNATSIQDQPGSVTYRWRSVRDADQYVIQICADQTFARVFRQSYTSDTVMVFSGHTEGQQYYWRVQAGNLAGWGLWSDVTNFTFATTDVQKQVGMPAEYSVSQNYPNPFNPTTRITFGLPQRGLTKITVYDLLGREVQSLINKELEAGYYDVTFDASKFQSGVYYYRIQSGEFSQTRQMILMK
jgi:hypothetical protein